MIATKEQILETLLQLREQRLERSIKEALEANQSPFSYFGNDEALIIYNKYIKKYSNG